MGIKEGDKVLITTNEWFYAPDGQQYRAVFGTFNGIKSQEDVLGIKANRGTAGYSIEIGNMIISGCQINYITKTDECSNQDLRHFDSSVESGVKFYHVPSAIYFADHKYKPSLSHGEIADLLK